MYFFRAHQSLARRRSTSASNSGQSARLGNCGTVDGVQVHLCELYEWDPVMGPLRALVFSSVRWGNTSFTGLDIGWMETGVKVLWKLHTLVQIQDFAGAVMMSLYREAMVQVIIKHPDTGLLVGEGHSWAKKWYPWGYLWMCLLGQETLNTYRDCTWHQHRMV